MHVIYILISVYNRLVQSALMELLGKMLEMWMVRTMRQLTMQSQMQLGLGLDRQIQHLWSEIPMSVRVTLFSELGATLVFKGEVELYHIDPIVMKARLCPSYHGTMALLVPEIMGVLKIKLLRRQARALFYACAIAPHVVCTGM